MGRPALRDGPYELDDEGEPLPLVVVMHRRREQHRLHALEKSARMRAVAAVARTFRLDPVAVAAEPDPFNRLVRIAAHNLAMREENKR